MNAWENILTNVSGTFPNTTAQNASGPSATDGTEWVASLINNGLFGWTQFLLSRASITPDEVVESVTSSQIFTAMQNTFAGMPSGIVLQWNLSSTPSSFGARALELNGQGVLRSAYPDLDANVYVGDANNAAVAAGGGAYYHADDAAGTTPNTAGAYLILPDTRGYAPRGLDIAGSVDPQGSSRFLGDNQVDAFQGWQLGATEDDSGARNYYSRARGRDVWNAATASSQANNTSPVHDTTSQGSSKMMKAVDDGTNGTPRTDSETRMSNFATKFVITY
ncbi:MAG: tail fiber protein [Candidatus Magnetoglobus multicellularis str. Araruama]|uniref:Tail fiber protein n=1 Tax=Candidatus Magnetoglobus multicellularis str. Araruama TaxID=890399 RepID=A0A1V1P1K0_9BACT|nr:MAG: tail fiber protein [Candidatus Magnetoglobus multicellularis str. Araruama]